MKIAYFLLFLFQLMNTVKSELNDDLNNHILINNKFLMMINRDCNNTIFIDTQNKEYFEGLENFIGDIKNLELVNSYSITYNYTNNNNIDYILSYVSTNNFKCLTDYSLNIKNSIKNNNNYDILLLCVIMSILLFTFCSFLNFLFNYIYKLLKFIRLI